jgi:hypothetical protein
MPCPVARLGADLLLAARREGAELELAERREWVFPAGD